MQKKKINNKRIKKLGLSANTIPEVKKKKRKGRAHKTGIGGS